MVIGGHFGGGDHFDGGDHFGGGTVPTYKIKVPNPDASSQQFFCKQTVKNVGLTVQL